MKVPEFRQWWVKFSCRVRFSGCKPNGYSVNISGSWVLHWSTWKSMRVHHLFDVSTIGYPDSTGFIWLLQRQQIVFCFLNLSRKVILRSSVELIFHISLILLWLVSNSTWSASEWGLRKYTELLNEKEFSLGLIISNFDDKNSVKWSVLRIQNHLLRMCCHNSNPCYPWNDASIISLYNSKSFSTKLQRFYYSLQEAINILKQISLRFCSEKVKN